jgi:uncharacterized protein YdeI (YjbR/CyaY-like superfamily)
MAEKDSRIDAYINKSEEFAKPILNHLRALIHKACPDVQEIVKWSSPHFDYKDSPLCHMASFKKHCAFGFWKASLMKDADKLMETAKSEEAMGHLGKITSLKNLPSDKVLIAYIKDAMTLNDAGIKLSGKSKPATKEQQAALKTPDYLEQSFKKHKEAKKVFEAFSYSGKKEYIEWLEDAKTEATRNKRLETALEWMAEGKSRHWKYKK